MIAAIILTAGLSSRTKGSNKLLLNYKGKKIIKVLFQKIKKKPSKFIKKSTYQRNNIERNICDFIAGMTDRYAINLYNSLL